MNRALIFLAVFAHAALLSAEPANAQAGKTPFKLLKEAGVRIEAAPYLDVAVDVSRFQPNIGSQSPIDTLRGLRSPLRLADTSLAVSALSLDLMLQPPVLASNMGFSSDRLQPYLAIGPQAIVTTEADETTKYAFPRSRQADLTTSLGLKIGAGMAWQFGENLGLFGEYRYFKPELHLRSFGAQTTSRPESNDYNLIGGFSFRF